MRKTLACLFILCILFAAFTAAAEGATPRFRFDTKVAVGFQGREVVVRVQLRNPNSVGHDVEAALQDENGTILATKTFTNNDFRSIKFTVPSDWLGAKYLSIWVDGEKVSEEDLFFAADDLDNKTLRQVGVSAKRIAITLDCAYGDKYTDELLDILDEYGVKVTFFVTGGWAETYPEHLRDIIARGHEIGNHSYAHPHLLEISYDRVVREIVRTSDAVEAATGIRPVLFRPPYGETDQFMRAISRALGCEHVFWTESSGDSDDKNSLNYIVRRIEKKVEPGYIYLFHNGGKHTAEALREIIPYFQSMGYEMVSVSTLLSEGPYRINADGLAEFSKP